MRCSIDYGPASVSRITPRTERRASHLRIQRPESGLSALIPLGARAWVPGNRSRTTEVPANEAPGELNQLDYVLAPAMRRLPVTDPNNCIFCMIVDGRAPSFQVSDDELTLAFMDIFPVAPGHSLVITKQHYSNIFEVPPNTLAAVARATRRLALAIRSELRPEGLGLFQLNGVAAGQTVFHYHQHLIPRSSGEDLKLHTRVRGDDDELRATSLRLAEKLATEP